MTQESISTNKMGPQDFTTDDRQKALERAKATIESESAAIRKLADAIGDAFLDAVEMIIHCKGRLIVTGMGKSGAIARKLAATFSSTGTPSIFLHPAEGVHGDLGMVTSQDIVLALSNSGQSDEIVDILPAITRIGARMISIVGNSGSTLASHSDIVIEVNSGKEACPLGLAPTTSTACALALGDALALAIMEARRFTEEDYALFHPGGTLGRRLLLRVCDVMRKGDAIAIVGEDANLRDVLFAITRAGGGAACVVATDGRLAGIITDGDVRRILLSDDSSLYKKASEVMTKDPAVITPDKLATEGMHLMEGPPKQIGELPVLEDGKPVGMLMLKDLVKAGLV